MVMANRLEKVLIDSSTNHYVESWQIDSGSIPHYEGPAWRITKYVLRGGRQHGVDAVEIHNGEMAITVVPTRGMNIMDARTEDVVMGWQSPVREVVHPAYIQAEARGGLGWLEGFNELMCRCGLENTGAPGPDVIVDNQGNQSTVTLPLHGRISNCPASRLWASVELQEPYRLTVSGEVPEARMFGPSYLLRTAISTLPGSTEFTISDRIQNLRAVPEEMELLYHCNYGPPILGEGARAVVPLRRLSARDRSALAGLKAWDRYGAPQAGFVEQCYFLTLHADRRGGTAVALVSPQGDLAASIRSSVRQLPAFTIWKNTVAAADGYVTGLEPGTDYPNSRRFEREKGRLVRIAPGATYEAEITMGLVRGRPAVTRLCNEISALCKGKPSIVCQGIEPELSPAGH